MKRIRILSLAVFFVWAASPAYPDDAPLPIPPQQTAGETGIPNNAGQPPSIMPQSMTPQPQAQQPQPITPQPLAQPSRRIQRSQQVQEQKQQMLQPGQGENIPQVEKEGAGGVSQQPTPQSPFASCRTSASSRGSARAGGMISLNFDDADVYSVVQTVFGEILRVNYVVDQRVKGRVTFRSVAPVVVDQVLPLMEVILRLNGMGVVEESGLYRIVPIGDVAKEPAQVTIGRDPDKIIVQGKSIIQVVPISYSSSSDMVKLVTPFLTTTAVVIDIPTMNYIIIVDTDANVKRILSIVSFFDSKEIKMKKPQVYVYHIQNSKAKDVASVLQQIFGTTTSMTSSSTTTTTSSGTSSLPATSPGNMPTPQPAHPPTSVSGPQTGLSSGLNTGGSLISSMTKIIPDENLNLLVVLALPEDYEIIKAAVKSIDIIPRQVVLEGVIAEVDLVDDLSLGISWALQFPQGSLNGVLGKVAGTVGFNSPGAATPVTSTSTTSTTSTATTATGTGTFTFAGTVGKDFAAVIDMLATQSKAKLLAVPHILVSDNKEARIQVGEQVPIVTSETFGSTTLTAPVRTIQYKDIGIILKVKPRINEGGLVSLDINQEISSYAVKKVTGTDEAIVVSKTEATTNLVVQGGQTIIIGGLIREDVSDGRAGIPLLGKIPVLGYLFGKTDKTNHRKELIILLTPRVIKNQADAQSVTSGYVSTITETGKGKITKEELLRNQKTNVPDNTSDNNTQNINSRNNGGEENNLERKD